MRRDGAQSHIKPSTHRRQLLIGAGTVFIGAVAGCTGLPGRDSTDELTFDILQRTAVYFDDRIDLPVPDEVQTVTATNNADLIMLPGEPGVGADQIAEWFADERTLALLGNGAEGTWLDWVQSDVYESTFDVHGFADGEPDPDLLVASALGLDLTTYNRTWGNGPRDRDVLRALDEVLVDIEDRRQE